MKFILKLFLFVVPAASSVFASPVTGLVLFRFFMENREANCFIGPFNDLRVVRVCEVFSSACVCVCVPNQMWQAGTGTLGPSSASLEVVYILECGRSHERRGKEEEVAKKGDRILHLSSAFIDCVIKLKNRIVFDSLHIYECYTGLSKPLNQTM